MIFTVYNLKVNSRLLINHKTSEELRLIAHFSTNLKIYNNFGD